MSIQITPLTNQCIADNTPAFLHQYIQEFVIGTPEDPETVAPITQYEPLVDDCHTVGAFMMYCCACGYFPETIGESGQVVLLKFETDITTTPAALRELLCLAIHEGHPDAMASLESIVLDIDLAAD